MAHVLFLTLVYPAAGMSTAVILRELSADLKAAGHDVIVVTTVPHYNRDTKAEARQPLVRMWGPFLYRSEFQGVRVLHVGMPRKSGRVLARFRAWVQFHVLSLIAVVALVRRADAIVVPSPPLTVGVCAWLLGFQVPLAAARGARLRIDASHCFRSNYERPDRDAILLA